MNPILKDYIKSNFPLTKTDLFAVFLEKGLEMIKDYGFNCMVTMQSWMFLSSFEKFRKKLIETTTISNLLHMDNMVMRIAFGTSATVFRKINLMNYNSTFYHVKLSDVENDIVNPLFFNDENKIIRKQFNFNKIPNSQIAYWADERLIELFEEGKSLDPNYGDTRSGMGTSDNKRFLRLWHEVEYDRIGFGCKDSGEALSIKKKWYPYNKGGSYCKWYGNQDYLINYENDGFEVKEYALQLYKTPTRTIKSISEYFKKSVSWSKISSGRCSFRFYPQGFIFDVAGCCIFFENEAIINYILGFLNSNVSNELLDFISPTINYEAGHIGSLPIIFDKKKLELINELVLKNIELCKCEWDELETSWNFKIHPLINLDVKSIKNNFNLFYEIKTKQFNLLKNNEIELNKIYSEIYSVKIDISIENKYVSIKLPEYESSIKSFISYAVGCMFGRYSLDNKGLQFAGGEFNINNYTKFIPDDDNIIPVLDSEYFEDDIVNRFVEFVKTCFGEETLEENLDFIANALAKNKKPSREKIRDYLLKNFFNDHKKTYKKCPIYWQFSSGKENGFNCLVYMHRYEPSLVARIRTDYLHKTQKAIEQAIANCDNIINHSSSKQEVVKATKDKAKLQKQLKETQEYDEALSHIANQNIEIDLDDGVKVNYAKFQNVQVSKEGKKAKKINLLKKL